MTDMKLTPEQIEAIRGDLRKNGQMPERGYTLDEIPTTSASRGVFACLRCKGIHAAGYMCDYGADAMGPHALEQNMIGLVGVGRSEATSLVAGAVGHGYAQARRFTREEVLTVIKAKRAEITAMANPLEVLAHLVGIFERME